MMGQFGYRSIGDMNGSEEEGLAGDTRLLRVVNDEDLVVFFMVCIHR